MNVKREKENYVGNSMQNTHQIQAMGDKHLVYCTYFYVTFLLWNLKHLTEFQTEFVRPSIHVEN